MKTLEKPPKDAVVRARCHVTLKDDVDEIARIQNVDSADVIRNALLDYVQRVRQSVRNMSSISR